MAGFYRGPRPSRELLNEYGWSDQEIDRGLAAGLDLGQLTWIDDRGLTLDDVDIDYIRTNLKPDPNVIVEYFD
jgi:hypothetical protein